MKKCTKCRRRSAAKPTLRAQCKDCTRDTNSAWEGGNPTKSGRFRKRKSRLKHEYAMTPLEYDALLIMQCGRCAICGTCVSQQRELSVDHNHTTGRVRGLLCQNCNGGIGLLNDDIGRLQQAIIYLKEEA